MKRPKQCPKIDLLTVILLFQLGFWCPCPVSKERSTLILEGNGHLTCTWTQVEC